MSICQNPSPTAGKKQRKATHKWASGSDLLRSTIYPLIWRQVFELIFGHDEHARSHRVMTETAKLVTRHFIVARACEAGRYVGDVARDYHGIGVGALDEETVGHIGAGQSKTNGCRGRHHGTLRNEHILFGN